MSDRYIPEDISKKVRLMHFFECAWCCTRLTERHHITEFSKGGAHTVDNLILLCPNCHTQVHKKEIKLEELVKRQSTHSRGDRIEGTVNFNLKNANFRIGGSHCRNVPILLMYKKEPIIELKQQNGEFLLSMRFYNKNGDLIFWMSSNRYWTLYNSRITREGDLLMITSNDSHYLKIWEDAGELNFAGNNYLNGMLVDFNPDYLQLGSSRINTYTVIDCKVGIHIE